MAPSLWTPGARRRSGARDATSLAGPAERVTREAERISRSGLQEDAAVARRLLHPGRASGVTPPPPCYQSRRGVRAKRDGYSRRAVRSGTALGQLGEERVDGPEQRELVALAEILDSLKAPHETSVLQESVFLGLDEPEDFVR